MTRMIDVVAEGEFGAAVARHVRALPVPTGGRTRVLIRAAWRDVPTDLTTFAAEAETPWLPVVMAHPFIRVGPLMVPGQPPCPTCMLIRLRQHGEDLDFSIAESMQADPALGARGYAPHHAMIAAGLALRLAATGEPGEMTALDTRTDETVRWHLIAADGCPGCAEAR